ALVDHSLVTRLPDDDGDMRFSMLETIRQFALELLDGSGELPGLRDRHADWCLALAKSAEPEVFGPDQLEWLALLDRELDNIRAALVWLDRGEAEGVERGLRLVGSLWALWYIRH